MELNTDFAVRAAYALGIGVLIGLERSVVNEPDDENRQRTVEAAEAADTVAALQATGATSAEGKAAAPVADADETMGVRTFASLSLVGFAGAMASQQMPLAGPVTLLGVIGIVLILYWSTVVRSPGITTEVAAIGTAVLGSLCFSEPHLAAFLGVVMTVLLSSKRFMHSTIRKMRRVEITDTLKFLVIILIVVPLLPNRALDPLGAVNPYKTGCLVVLISGIGFVGYFLTRLLGAQKGLGLTGLLGGLTSSTAVTAAMAAESKAAPQLKSICAFSTVVANATSFVRVLIMVTILDIALAKMLAWSLGGMAVTAIVAAAALWVSASREQVTGTTEREGQVKLKNPFALGPALWFAAFFLVIIVISKVAKIYLGNAGIYLAAAISGLADVDAITMSVAEQGKDGSLLRPVGVMAITIAVVSNAIVKSTMAMTTGSKEFGRLVALSLGAAVFVGLTLALFAPV